MISNLQNWRWLPLMLVLGWVPWLSAHEPYLMLVAEEPGLLVAEAGFSDGADAEGLGLMLHDRATGELLSEHRFPAGGVLRLPLPAVPYRVTFEGGPGHQLSRIGPELPSGAEDLVVESAVSNATEGSSGSPRMASKSGRGRSTLVVAMFIVAGISFCLGYAAASRTTPGKQ